MIRENIFHTPSFLKKFHLNSSDIKSLTINCFSVFSMKLIQRTCLIKQLQTAIVFKPKPQFVFIYARLIQFLINKLVPPYKSRRLLPPRCSGGLSHLYPTKSLTSSDLHWQRVQIPWIQIAAPTVNSLI